MHYKVKEKKEQGGKKALKIAMYDNSELKSELNAAVHTILKSSYEYDIPTDEIVSYIVDSIAAKKKYIL